MTLERDFFRIKQPSAHLHAAVPTSLDKRIITQIAARLVDNGFQIEPVILSLGCDLAFIASQYLTTTDNISNRAMQRRYDDAHAFLKKYNVPFLLEAEYRRAEAILDHQQLASLDTGEESGGRLMIENRSPKNYRKHDGDIHLDIDFVKNQRLIDELRSLGFCYVVCVENGNLVASLTIQFEIARFSRSSNSDVFSKLRKYSLTQLRMKGLQGTVNYQEEILVAFDVYNPAETGFSPLPLTTGIEGKLTF